jgi:ATP-dependent helicase/DNAse subunit B
MTTYSFSQISTYRQCPRKYQFHYLDRLKTKTFETTYELLLGSLVHQSLEWLYLPLIKQTPPNTLFPPTLPTKSELLTYFSHHREKEIKKLTSTIRETTKTTPDVIRQRAETYLSTYYDNHFTGLQNHAGMRDPAELQGITPEDY